MLKQNADFTTISSLPKTHSPLITGNQQFFFLSIILQLCSATSLIQHPYWQCLCFIPTLNLSGFNIQVLVLAVLVITRWKSSAYLVKFTSCCLWRNESISRNSLTSTNLSCQWSDDFSFFPTLHAYRKMDKCNFKETKEPYIWNMRSWSFAQYKSSYSSCCREIKDWKKQMYGCRQ